MTINTLVKAMHVHYFTVLEVRGLQCVHRTALLGARSREFVSLILPVSINISQPLSISIKIQLNLRGVLLMPQFSPSASSSICMESSDYTGLTQIIGEGYVPALRLADWQLDSKHNLCHAT